MANLFSDKIKFSNLSHIKTFRNNDFPTPAPIEEILDQLLFLNPESDLRSNNPYFYCIPPNNVSDKFNTVRDIYKFL